MSINVRFSTVAVLAASAFVLQASAQDLPTDPSLVTGQLENGLTYIVRKHSNPPQRAAIWIHFHSGSLNETDRQRGIAHYLEHMAFNGSTNFPPGSVVPFFQSLGMTFGRDQNAFTNFEQTTYQLSLPDAKPETLGKGMSFFSDVTSKLSLLPKEIDAERQIIQEERRRGLSGRQRTSFYVIEHMTPGSLFGQRITIGTEETINGVNEADFKDYYGKWYGASNATLIVLADAEPADVVKVIKDKFSDAPKRPRPTPQNLNVKAYDKNFGIVTSDPELRSANVQIVRLEPARPAVTTVPLFRDELVLRLATFAINRRFDDKVAKGGVSYQSANVSAGNGSNAIYTTELSARAEGDKWKPALEETAMELQRARAFGFTVREIDDAKKELLSNAERAVETEATVAAQQMMGRINGAIAQGEPVMSSQQRLDLLKKILPTISPEEASKRFADEFDPKAVAFVAVLPSSATVPSESQLVEIGVKALAVKPTQETEAVHATSLMTELPKPGTFAELTEHAPSQVWSGWLSNNVRVHYRFMDYRKNQVSVNISLVGGELLETAANRGITQGAQLAFSRPATKNLSSSDIRELMTGKKVNVRGGGGFGGMGGGRGGRGGGGGGGGDSISLSVSGSPEELETGFQLAYLLLTQPKVEAAPFDQFKTMAKQALQEVQKNPQLLGMMTTAAAPYPDSEVRTRPPTAEEIDRLTVQDSQAWLEKLVKESPIEIGIVGDISKDRAMELAARYVGSLPERPRVTPDAYANLRKISRPKGARTIEKTLDTPTPQAFVYSGFYGADDSNLADVRALSMASRILSTRMVKEVREEAQLVYSISASSRAATTFPGFGVFSAGAPTEPSKASALVAKLSSMYETFAKDGPTEEELVVAKKQRANDFDEQMKEPTFWSGRIDNMTLRGRKLDDVLADPAAYQALTATQIKDTFAKYYSKDNSIVVTIKPNVTTTEQPAGGAK